MTLVRTIPARDLALTESGDLRWFTGVEAIGQAIGFRLRTFLGEWFLDRRRGVPYRRDILRRNPDLEVVRSVLRRTILGTPGVLSVPELSVTLDRRTRRLLVGFLAKTIEGDVDTRTNRTEVYF